MKRMVKEMVSDKGVKVIQRRAKEANNEEVQGQIMIEIHQKVLYTDTDNLIEIKLVEG